MLTKERQRQLENYFKEQDDKARRYFDKANEVLNRIYGTGQFEPLKQALKTILADALKSLKKDEKLAITLIDIQNDFTLEQFSLYAPHGETTILHNMALLDAILELHQENPIIIKQLDIITTQDAHRIDRTFDDKEALIFAKTYSIDQMKNLVEHEQMELKPLNPAENSYGLHCMIGSIGAAIARTIEKRLHLLSLRSFNIHRFGKINFSAPEAGMRLLDGIDISNPCYRDPTHSIYPDVTESFLDFFKKQSFKSIYITGICGNVCVQQAAEGIKANLPETSIQVIDACVHYLVVPGINTYDKTRNKVMISYRDKEIVNLEIPEWRSNPSCESELYPCEKKGSYEENQTFQKFFDKKPLKDLGSKIKDNSIHEGLNPTMM